MWRWEGVRGRRLTALQSRGRRMHVTGVATKGDSGGKAAHLGRGSPHSKQMGEGRERALQNVNSNTSVRSSLTGQSTHVKQPANNLTHYLCWLFSPPPNAKQSGDATE